MLIKPYDDYEIISGQGTAAKEILVWKHPRPLAQTADKITNFINCNHFLEVNNILLVQNIIQKLLIV